VAVRDDSGGSALPYYVYILASGRNGTLYVGVTNELVRRIYEHRNKLIGGFTGRYRVHHLVYYEAFDEIEDAIVREKRLKRWHRKWKIELIEKHNEDWHDLWPTLAAGGG
jgi:putative endonuclease